MDAEFWDERYRGRDRLFSGEPNGVLVAEAARLRPGRALDVGCGEGGDAVWLASRGWLVQGLDIAPTALERARVLAGRAGVADRVEWVLGDVAAAPLEAGAFDLVSAQYFPLLKSAGSAALAGLVSAVAPGGVLLVVGHDPGEVDPAHGFDPDRFVMPGAVAAALGEGWSVEVDQVRARTVPAPAGTGHTRDVVLLARRAGCGAASGDSAVGV